MINYQVFVQEKDVGIISAKNTGRVLNIVGERIKNGSIVIDTNIPHNIKIVKV